jgi:hypothetical protein
MSGRTFPTQVSSPAIRACTIQIRAPGFCCRCGQTVPRRSWHLRHDGIRCRLAPSPSPFLAIEEQRLFTDLEPIPSPPRLERGRCGARQLCGATRIRLGGAGTASYTGCGTARGPASNRKGASDGSHSHIDRHHGDHVVYLPERGHPRDDLGPEASKSPFRFKSADAASGRFGSRVRPPSSRFLGDELRIVVEDGREPALGLGKAPILACGVVFDLVAADLAHAEIAGLWM